MRRPYIYRVLHAGPPPAPRRAAAAGALAVVENCLHPRDHNSAAGCVKEREGLAVGDLPCSEALRQLQQRRRQPARALQSLPASICRSTTTTTAAAAAAGVQQQQKRRASSRLVPDLALQRLRLLRKAKELPPAFIPTVAPSGDDEAASDLLRAALKDQSCSGPCLALRSPWSTVAELLRFEWAEAEPGPRPPLAAAKLTTNTPAAAATAAADGRSRGGPQNRELFTVCAAAAVVADGAQQPQLEEPLQPPTCGKVSAVVASAAPAKQENDFDDNAEEKCGKFAMNILLVAMSSLAERGCIFLEIVDNLSDFTISLIYATAQMFRETYLFKPADANFLHSPRRYVVGMCRNDWGPNTEHLLRQMHAAAFEANSSISGSSSSSANDRCPPGAAGAGSSVPWLLPPAMWDADVTFLRSLADASLALCAVQETAWVKLLRHAKLRDLLASIGIRNIHCRASTAAAVPLPAAAASSPPPPTPDKQQQQQQQQQKRNSRLARQRQPPGDIPRQPPASRKTATPRATPRVGGPAAAPELPAAPTGDEREGAARLSASHAAAQAIKEKETQPETKAAGETQKATASQQEAEEEESCAPSPAPRPRASPPLIIGGASQGEEEEEPHPGPPHPPQRQTLTKRPVPSLGRPPPPPSPMSHPIETTESPVDPSRRKRPQRPWERSGRAMLRCAVEQRVSGELLPRRRWRIIAIECSTD